MASGVYNIAKLKVGQGLLDLDGDTLKLVLIGTAYTFDPDHDDVAEVLAASGELTATNYTAGYGGAGRKTATVTCQVNNTDNRADFAIADLTWTALGGAVNGTVVGALLIKEVTNDAGSIPIAYFDITDTPTNGGDFTLDFASLANGGNFRLA